MELETLRKFWMYCTIISATLLFFWSLIFLICPGLVYRTQKRWFPLSEENFGLVFYSFLGIFKIFFLIFHLIPYLALEIMS